MSVEPQEPPCSSHWSMPRCSRRRSMSAIRCAVVLWRMSVAGSLACCVRRAACCVLRAAAATALVEQDDPIALRVEVPAHTRTAARARHAVHDERGVTARIAAGLPAHEIAVTDLDHPPLVRLNRRVQPAHACSSLRESARETGFRTWSFSFRTSRRLRLPCGGSRGSSPGASTAPCLRRCDRQRWFWITLITDNAASHSTPPMPGVSPGTHHRPRIRGGVVNTGAWLTRSPIPRCRSRACRG